MHKGRAILKVTAILIAIAVIVTTILIGIKQTDKKASAADPSNNYKFAQLKIGGGGWLTGIVAQPTTPNLLYARADVGGLYKLDIPTKTWKQLFVTGAVSGTPDSTDYNVESVAVSKTNNQIVYAAVGLTWDFSKETPTGRILKSTNQGKTWTTSTKRWHINGNADYRQQGERLAVDPSNENVVYFGSRNEGLWRTTDGAKTWSQIPTNQVPLIYKQGDNNPAGVKFVVFDPTSGTINGHTKRVYASVAGAGVYMSEDGGNSWSNIYQMSDVPVCADVASDGRAYLSMSSSRLLRYTPATHDMHNVTPPGGDGYLTISADPFNPQRLISGTSPVSSGHLYLSTNGGDSWNKLNATIASPDIPWMSNSDEAGWLSVGNIIFDPQIKDRVLFGQGIGVWTTTLNGSNVTWTSMSKGIEEMVSTDIVVPPGGKPVTTNWDRQGFYHDNVDQYPQKELMNEKFSSGWSLDYSGKNPQFLVGVFSDHRFLNPDYSGYSADGGKTWKQFTASSTANDRFGGNIAVSATDPKNVVWLPTFGRAPYSSTDQGAHWNSTDSLKNVTGLHVAYYLSQRKALASDKVQGSTFYIYSSNGAFYRSTDGGKTWAQTAKAPTNGADSWVNSQIHTVFGQAGNVWVSTAQGGLSYTQNMGATWTKVAAVQEAKAFGFGKALPGASYPAVYANAKIKNQWGIWRSSDKGANWTLISTAPLGIYDQVNAVSGDPNIATRVYVGFGGNGFAYGDTNGSTPPPGNEPTPTKGTPTPRPTVVVPTPAPAGGPVSNGHYQLVSKNDGLVLDDVHSGGAGTHLTQEANNNQASQKWNVSSVGNGYYKITDDSNNLALSLNGGSTEKGTATVVQPYSGSDDQLWRIVDEKGGYYKIVNKKSGQVLAVSGDWTNQGNPIIEWPWNGKASQLWQFKKV